MAIRPIIVPIEKRCPSVYQGKRCQRWIGHDLDSGHVHVVGLDEVGDAVQLSGGETDAGPEFIPGEKVTWKERDIALVTDADHIAAIEAARERARDEEVVAAKQEVVETEQVRKARELQEMVAKIGK